MLVVILLALRLHRPSQQLSRHTLQNPGSHPRGTYCTSASDLQKLSYRLSLIEEQQPDRKFLSPGSARTFIDQRSKEVLSGPERANNHSGTSMR